MKTPHSYFNFQLSNSILLFISLIFLLNNVVYSQTPIIIGAGALSGTSASTATGDCGPMYRSNATSTFIFARHHYLYTAAELAAAGLTPGSLITELAWNKDNACAFTGPAAFEIWMKNSSLTTVQTPPQPWSTLITGSTRVYNNTSYVMGAAIGYVSFPFSTPFIYTGGAIEISTNYDHSATTTPWSTLGLSWKKDNTTGTTISISGAAASTSLSAARTVRPQLRITWIANRGFNDAGITQLMSSPKFCGTSQNLLVRLANAGINIINNVTVNWSVDGITQTPIAFASPLDTMNHPTNRSDTTLNLGSIAYTPNQSRSILVWSSMPNGIADTTTRNDTLRVILRPGLNGTYTLGGFSPDFPSFTSALNNIDSFGKCGPLVYNVTDGSVFKENPLTLRNLDSITFQKFGTGANPIVFGVNGIANQDAVFKIVGSKNIVFNGIDVADSISNSSTVLQMEYGYALVNSSATNGSSNNTIKNCKITLNRINTASFGIVQSTTAIGGGIVATALSGGNHNNRYENVKIENVYKGIGLIGTAGFPDSNCVITSTGADTTIVGANIPNDIGNGTLLVYGINAADQKNVEISKCLVRNLTHSGTSTTQGIFIDNGSTTVDYGIARVWGNTLHTINRVTTTSVTGTIHGIRIDVSTTAAARVWNNIVYNINAISTPTAASANQIVRGISFGTTIGTGTAEFYHNSVSINSSGLNNSSVAFWKGAAGTVTARNNIFSNTSPAQIGISKHFATYVNAGSIVTSNNVLWAANANGFIGFIAAIDYTYLHLFNAVTSPAAPSDGNGRGSANANPNFISATNLDFAGATPAVNSGTPLTTPILINTDILGVTRSASAPTIGAYETTQSLFDSSAPVISNITIINRSTPIIRANIVDNLTATSAGNVQLWYRAGTTGAFTSLSPDSIPVGLLNGTYKWDAVFASLAVGSYQFYIAARDITGAGNNIAVNPIQGGLFSGFSSIDPVNYTNNPDTGVNIRSFSKLSNLAGGVYTVGPTGTYAKLTNIANALNTTDLSGNVIFELQPTYDGTTGETFPIIFNQFGTIGGNWTVTIRPASGASGLQLRGSSATTLVDLNGVKRITFDGRPGGVGSTKQLTLTNVSNAGSVVRFINDAQNDTLKFITLLDSNISTTSGMIVFGNTNVGSTATNGNNNNGIDNCEINGLSNTANCVYALGSISPADNKNNTITNCNIFDFFSNSVGSVNGILIEAGNSFWNIGTASNGNNFYQTANRNSTSSPALTIAVGFRAIQINSATVIGCNIIGNRIGGNIPGITGSTFSIGDNIGATAYLLHFIRAIDIVAAGATVATSIQGNTISNLTVYTGLNVNQGGFSAINVFGGLVNTGNITGNTIGETTGTGSISIFYKNTATIVNFYGIQYRASSGGLIQNNLIGSMSADAASGGIQLICLYLGGAFANSVTMSNNIIGSFTTPHSVQSTSSSLAPVAVFGIVTSGATGANITISSNTLINLSSLCNNVGDRNILKGIYITGASSLPITVSGNIVRKLYSESTNPAINVFSAISGITSISSSTGAQTISGNTITALVSGTTTGAINIIGIYYASTTTAAINRIERNLIHSLNASNNNGSAAIVSGITQGGGTTKLIIANNMIRLGFDSTGTSATGAHFITGIQKIGGALNTTVFNSINIGGTGVSIGVSNSFAYRSASVGVDSLLNNIFVNTRSNATTGGLHYAIGLGANTTLTINRNLYNSSSPLGQFNNIDQSTLVDWRSATVQDSQSVNTTVNFVSNTDLHLTGSSIGNLTLAGIPVSGFTTDYDLQTRNSTAPYMGADEIPSSPLPVELILFTAKSNELDAQLNWSTASETNNSHFEIERSTNGNDFTSIGNIKGNGSAKMVSNYTFTDAKIGASNSLVYYRLKQVDFDGNNQLSKLVIVAFYNNEVAEATAIPNPFSESLSILLEGEPSELVIIEIVDIQGRLLLSETKKLYSTNNSLKIEDSETLQNGFYFVKIISEKNIQVIKVLKQ